MARDRLLIRVFHQLCRQYRCYESLDRLLYPSIVCRQIYNETAFLPFSLNPLHVGFGELATIKNLIPAGVVACFKKLSVFNDRSLKQLKESGHDVNLEALCKFPDWKTVLVVNMEGEVQPERTEELRMRVAAYAGAAGHIKTS